MKALSIATDILTTARGTKERKTKVFLFFFFCVYLLNVKVNVL